jgi:hypothetical protein
LKSNSQFNAGVPKLYTDAVSAIKIDEGEKFMSEITVENIVTQIVQLPPVERFKLRRLLDQLEQAERKSPKSTLDKRVPPIPVPDSAREMRWITDHQREYAGQWVALDGDRLIAHGPNHDEVWAAAEADGAYLPMIVFIEDPDKIYAGF